MKKKLTLVLITLLALGSFIGAINTISEKAKAGTPKSGIISADETWTTVGSPYWIEGDVTVASGANLTIEPGVEVKFNGDYSLYVDGNLTAVGLDTNRIEITTNITPILYGNWNRIQINPTGHAVVKYSDISWCDYGIYLNSSSNNTLTNSNVSMTLWNGIHLLSSSSNTIANNAISMSNGQGIYLSESSNNTLKNNTIANNHRGIFFESSSNNQIEDNSIYGNDYGILLMSSSYNIIRNNNILKNEEYGIYLYPSLNNRIFHNNIIDNKAYDRTNDNFWNDAYPSGGNYWHSYGRKCTDNFHGANTPQTSGSPDGICDFQHNITFDHSAQYTLVYSVDYYPLKNPIENNLLLDDTTPPTADADYRTGMEWYRIALEGYGSTDDIGVFNYTWNITRNGELIAVLYGVITVYEFDIGTYEVMLTVRDYAGNTDTDNITVEVKPYTHSKGDDPWVGLYGMFLFIIIITIALYLLAKKGEKKEPIDSEEKEESTQETKSS